MSTIGYKQPPFLLMYITLSWGGAKKQAAKIDTGNLDAKNWQDEARKIVEKNVHCLFCLYKLLC